MVDRARADFSRRLSLTRAAELVSPVLHQVLARSTGLPGPSPGRTFRYPGKHLNTDFLERGLPRELKMYGVELIVDTNANIYHLSMMNTGLVALADRGKIHLNYRRPLGSAETRLAADPLAFNLVIHPMHSKKSSHVVIDLRDKSDHFAQPALESCDLYFKRSFHQTDVDRLGTDLVHKVGLSG